MYIRLSETKTIPVEQVTELYKANEWSSAQSPSTLYNGLMNSHTLLSAWDGDRLVGLGNAIADGYLVVYYPHLLVHPDYHGQGVGKRIVERFQEKYGHYHMQILTADQKAIAFYEKAGFTKAGDTQAMWIYKGKEHG